jgi:oxygen-dependent protoporphyrinogen oxidase
MLGTIDPRQKKVTIIGAGISGLIIGYVLKRKGFEVQIFEASSRAGGLIHTQKTLYGMSEKAAHSILVSAEIQTFFDELKVDLQSVNPDSKARFIFRKGKMRRMPLTLLELFRTAIRFFSKPRFSLNPKSSLGDWCRAYLGNPPLQFLLSPFVTGIFACSPDELNARLTFPKLVPIHPAQSLFRFIRSKPKSSAPRPQMKVVAEGTEKLVERLSDELKDEIHYNHAIHDLSPYLDSNLILATPTSAAANLLAVGDPASSELLKQVRYSPLVSMTAFYREQAFSKQPPKGVGVLIPRNEGFRMLGCLFNSSAFANRAMKSFVSLTVMVGGTADPLAIGLSDDELFALVDLEARSLFSATEAPTHLEIARWTNAIPVFSNELKMALESLVRGFCAQPGRIVFTNYSKEVSIRGMIETALKI